MGRTKRLYLTEDTGDTEKKYLIVFLNFVISVVSVREIYSVMHNIMDIKKIAKRITVKLEP